MVQLALLIANRRDAILENSEFQIAARSTSRFKNVTIHDSLEDFCKANRLSSGLNSFEHGGLIYDFYYQNNNAEVTLFSFAASTKRKEKLLPIFTGASVFSDLPVNLVLVADPSLAMSEDLPLAWYASCLNGVRTQDVLREAILALIEMFDNHPTIMFGASGGGFAALYYAHNVKNCLAIAINPQTDIKLYVDKYVRRYAKVFLTAKDDSDVIRALNEDIDASLIPLYQAGYANSILYLQNKSDWHVEEHMKPFIEALQSHVPQIMGEWGNGHIAPPKDFLRSLTERLLSSASSGWEDAVANVADRY